MPEIKADGFVYSPFSPGWMTVGVFSVVSQRSGLRSSSQAHVMCCTLMCLPFTLFHCLSFTSARGVAVLSKGQMPRPSPFRLLSRDCLFPQILLPIPSATKFILFSVISVKWVRGPILVHRSSLLPLPSLSPEDFNFCKDLQTQDFLHSTTYFNLDHIDSILAGGEGVIKSALEWFLPLPLPQRSLSSTRGWTVRQVGLGHQGVGVKLMLEEKSSPTSPHTYKKIPLQTLSKENCTVSPWLWSPYFK